MSWRRSPAQEIGNGFAEIDHVRGMAGDDLEDARPAGEPGVFHSAFQTRMGQAARCAIGAHAPIFLSNRRRGGNVSTDPA